MLLILASPQVLSEPSGAGARPVHPIRVELRRCNSLVAIGGITDIGMRWSRKARLRMTRSGSEGCIAAVENVDLCGGRGAIRAWRVLV